MADYPVFPLWTDAYLADTGHLTALEHGAYLLLLITAWRAGGTLPDDDRTLCRYARMTLKQWLRIKPRIAAFWRVEDGVWTQGRLTGELDAVRQKSKSKSRSARARWLKYNETAHASASVSQCEIAPSLNPSPRIPPSIPDGIEAPPKRSSASQATVLPEGWRPDEALWAWSAAERPDIDIERELAMFTDYWRAKAGADGRKRDWPATWRNWIRRSRAMNGNHHGSGDGLDLRATPKLPPVGAWSDEELTAQARRWLRSDTSGWAVISAELRRRGLPA